MRDLQSATTGRSEQTSLASKTFLLLTLSAAIAAGGAYIGLGLQHAVWIVIACIVAQLVGLFILRAVRENTALSLAVLAGWMVISGITLGVFVQPYLEMLGAQTVIAALLGTTGVTALCGIVAAFSGINFQPLQKGLTIALLALIVVGIVSWFTNFSPMVNMLYSGIGMVVFAGFLLVDFYRMTKSGNNAWSEAISITVSIYLDFVNFFLFLLRFLSSSRR